MPRLPKDIELVIVSDDDKYPRQIAEMMQAMGLKARYLQGGIKSWRWDMKRSETDRDISPRELKEIRDTEDNRRAEKWGAETINSIPLSSPTTFLLDVREPDEFRQWSIEGSINIPLSELLSRQELLDSIPRDKKIITICPHGNRSTIAKYFLERYGYNVSSLEGGLKAWSSAFEDVYKEIDISSAAASNNNNNNGKVKLLQIRRIGKGCISYVLGSKDEAVVIDPVYPIEYYVTKASEMGAKITKVFDKHQHADHVSAAKELAKITGAIRYQSYYEQEEPANNHEKKSVFPLVPKFSPLYDGDLHKIGASILLKVIHTPGHTNGSISLLVKGSEQNNSNTSSADSRHYLGKSLLFTGDTLFVNGVGRPDLR